MRAHNGNKSALAPGLSVNARNADHIHQKCLALLAIQSASRIAADADAKSNKRAAQSSASRYAEQLALTERYASVNREPRAGIGSETLSAQQRDAQRGIAEEKKRQDILDGTDPAETAGSAGESSGAVGSRATAAQKLIEETKDAHDRKALSRMLPKSFARRGATAAATGGGNGGAFANQEDADDAVLQRRESGKTRQREEVDVVAAAATTEKDAGEQLDGDQQAANTAPAAPSNTNNSNNSGGVRRLAPDPRAAMAAAAAKRKKK